MLFNSMNFISNRRDHFSLGFRFGSLITLFFLFISFGFLSSCTSAKEVTYFNDLTDSQLVRLPDLRWPQPVIMPQDVLAIRFAGDSKLTEELFNRYGIASSQAGLGSEYQVDHDGKIDLYQLGAIKAAGYTVKEFKRILTDSISTYLKNPVVTIKFTNFRFTVLGEVRVPGTFVVAADKVTILEALGQSGDMTQYARRNSVRVIRDSSGTREIGMVNFNQKTVFTSPYYFLQRNDVVYVEPQKSKTEYESVNRITGIVMLSINAGGQQCIFLHVQDLGTIRFGNAHVADQHRVT